MHKNCKFIQQCFQHFPVERVHDSTSLVWLFIYSHSNCHKHKYAWVVKISPTVHLWDLGLQGECPPWGVFLRDPSPCLSEICMDCHPKKIGLNTARNDL